MPLRAARTCALLVLSAALAVLGTTRAQPGHGAASRSPAAYFLQRSYAPGERATLVVRTTTGHARVQVFRVGAAGRRMKSDRAFVGVPVQGETELPLYDGDSGRRAIVPIYHWPSGLYFARVTVGGRTCAAPFVLRPRKLGAAAVAAVLPTNTWQAYNKIDDDGDARGDSWYFSPELTTISLSRPYANGGVPPFFRTYDFGFLEYLDHSRRSVDMLADDDLARFSSGARLARMYELIVFSGHEEYVTPHAYDLITQYRDAGGNLMFLSANNFFWRVVLQGDSITRTSRWRDLGRPEASLIGAGYIGWDEGKYPSAPFVVRGARRVPWLFADTGVGNGSRFGHFGIEVDATATASPPGTIVVADIPGVLGPGRSAEMTYYETEAGAKVFAAGAMNFGGSASNPVVAKMLDNLFERLSHS